MEGIRQTRPWFWILIAALAVVAVGALVIAISASNESTDQKKVAEEAGEHAVAKVAGVGQAVKAVEELQAEGQARDEADRKQIDKQVAKAVEGGEGEVRKLKQRISALEGETESIAKDAAAGKREAQAAGAERKELTAEQEDLADEVNELGREVKGLERQVEQLGR